MIFWAILSLHAFALLLILALATARNRYSKIEEKDIEQARFRGLYAAQYELRKRKDSIHREGLEKDAAYLAGFVEELTWKTLRDARRIAHQFDQTPAAFLGLRLLLFFLAAVILGGKAVLGALAFRLGGWVWDEAIVGLALSMAALIPPDSGRAGPLLSASTSE